MIGLDQLQLRKPCRNCPFRNGPERITFACRERAEEIEESAYRNGFPCHLSAELDEYIPDDTDEPEEGYFFGPRTQHCAGAAAMWIKDGEETWPGIGNRELPDDYMAALMETDAFDSVTAFLEANS
jgi:hypothetical protein